MSFQRQVHDLPTLHSYADALKTHNNIRPLPNGMRPLSDNRRKRDVTIREDRESVVVQYHSTDLITYFKGGRIVVNGGGWMSSISTRNVVERVSGVRLRCHYGNVWFHSQHGWLPWAKREYTFRRERGDYGYELHLAEPPQYPVVERVDRVRYNAVKKRFKPFIDYMIAKIRLMQNEDGFASMELIYRFRFDVVDSPTFEQAFYMDGASGDNFEAALAVLYGRELPYFLDNGNRTIDEYGFKQRIAAYIKNYYPEVWEQKTITDGSIVRLK